MARDMTRDQVLEILEKYDPKLRQEIRENGAFYGIHVEMYARYLKEKHEKEGK